jgi:hypothetical protein
MRWLAAFARFWVDFIIGDDWRIAAAVVGVLVIGALVILAGLDGPWLAPVLGVALVITFSMPMLRHRDDR